MPVKRHTAGPSGGEKRTRFVSPPPLNQPTDDADDLLEEDLPENAAKIKSRSKRQLRDVDGYGSDSSNDEEGVVPSRRADGKEEGDEDDDVDMFADNVDEKAGAETKKKGKGKDNEFMSLDQIEGQEFSRDEDEEEYDGDEAARKRKEGLDGDFGVDITPFNMKDELEEGRFTADGESYQVNEKDPNEKHDVWLQDMDEEAIEKARKAHEERERLEREREAQEDKGLTGGEEKQEDLMRLAVGLMQTGETVLEALQRLGKQVEDKRKKEEASLKKKSWAEKQKERKAAAAAEAQQANDPYHTANPFTNLTNIISDLTSVSNLDVYSLSRESLRRMLPSAPPNGNGQPSAPPPPPPKDERQFQYRFSMSYIQSLPQGQRPVEREVFGPFPVLQLRGWRGTGAFGGPECPNIELRKAGEDGPWGPWSEIVG